MIDQLLKLNSTHFIRIDQAAIRWSPNLPGEGAQAPFAKAFPRGEGSGFERNNSVGTKPFEVPEGYPLLIFRCSPVPIGPAILSVA